MHLCKLSNLVDDIQILFFLVSNFILRIANELGKSRMSRNFFLHQEKPGKCFWKKGHYQERICFVLT